MESGALVNKGVSLPARQGAGLPESLLKGVQTIRIKEMLRQSKPIVGPWL